MDGGSISGLLVDADQGQRAAYCGPGPSRPPRPAEVVHPAVAQGVHPASAPKTAGAAPRVPDDRGLADVDPCSSTFNSHRRRGAGARLRPRQKTRVLADKSRHAGSRCRPGRGAAGSAPHARRRSRNVRPPHVFDLQNVDRELVTDRQLRSCGPRRWRCFDGRHPRPAPGPDLVGRHRESEQPIHRYFGACCRDRRSRSRDPRAKRARPIRRVLRSSAARSVMRGSSRQKGHQNRSPRCGRR